MNNDTGPKVTLRSHDKSKAFVTMHGGSLDAKSKDRSRIDLKMGERSHEVPVDWQKWGFIAALVSILVSILIAVLA